MNIYPYNTGHLMILPYDHVSLLIGMSAEAQCEMMRLASYFTELLTTVMRPDGFNVGMNLGRAAGAGIDSHLHLHIVPRWSGDSSFMAVVSNTRTLPETLEATYERIVAAMQQYPPQL
jgi:ATP adenylyltransferase